LITLWSVPVVLPLYSDGQVRLYTVVWVQENDLKSKSFHILSPPALIEPYDLVCRIFANAWDISLENP
jgi:hypothetical protein